MSPNVEELDSVEKHLLELWRLSCEDMQLINGGCDECEMKDVCGSLTKKLAVPDTAKYHGECKLKNG